MTGFDVQEPETAIPSAVTRVLREVSEAVEGVLGAMRGAEDVEWVSDAAPLYLLHLDRARRLVIGVCTRIDAADRAMRALARSA